MKRGPLWKVAVTTSAEAEEAAAELLARVFGQTASTYANHATRLSTTSVFLDKVSTAPASARSALAAGLDAIASCGLDVRPGTINIRKVRSEDWAESWKRHFKPMEIGPALLIKPSWSRRRPRLGQAVVILDPGLSFGTGQHPTTRFCLEQIVACRDGGSATSFLDMGTGSGILAIAAAKLGYKPVPAFDFDPEAVRIARENAAENGVNVRVRPVRKDLKRLPMSPPCTFDLICANLLFDLLIAERRRILNRLSAHGRLVLAGILTGQFGPVERAYRSMGLQLVDSASEGEWMSGAFEFRH